MQIISELEGYRRGPYAGAVGYALPGEALDTCIAIRTIVLHDGVALLQAGAGIVADSDPAAEHEECLRKLAALETAIDLAEARRDDPARSTTTTRSPTTSRTSSASSARRSSCAATTRSTPTRPSGSRRRTSSSPPVPAGPADAGASVEIVRRLGPTRADARRLPRPPGDRRGVRRRGRPGAARSCTARRATVDARRPRALPRACPSDFEAGPLPLARGDARSRTRSRSRAHAPTAR